MMRKRGTRPDPTREGLDAPLDEDGLPISPAQCRMARAGLVMSVRELARLAGVSGLTVTRFENGNVCCPLELVARFRRVLEAKGARFLSGEDGVKIED